MPVQRDATGNPILDQSGKPLLVNNAVTVAQGYTISNGPGNQYANLLPPQVVNKQTVTVPAYSDLKQQELASKVPPGTATVTFNAQQNPINNASEWAKKFPAPGTAGNPKVVLVTNGGLNIPENVDLSNYAITVQSGDINFIGSGHDLNSVVLVTNNGNINLGNVWSNDLAVFASRSINMYGGALFAGETLLANGSAGGSITFNGATATINSTDNLRAISQGSITYSAAAPTRGTFTSVGNFTFNNNSTLVGALAAKGNIVFNGSATVIANALDTQPPVITAKLALDTAPGNTTNTDNVTLEPTITGTVTDNSAIAFLRAGFNNTQTANFVDVTGLLGPSGSFTFNRTQLEQIYGSPLVDGLYTLRLVANDSSGNSSSLFNITFKLDTTSPAPTGLDLLASGDSGISDSDNITNNTTPTISGFAEAGTSIKLFSNDYVVGQTKADANGLWQLTTTQLTDGTYALTVTATDTAGNVSPVSTPFNIVIDSLAPIVPNSLKLTAASDSGVSNSDGLTNNPLPSIEGQADPGSMIRLFQDGQLLGTTTATADGDWLVTVDSLDDGSYNFTASAADLAGNVSEVSDTLAIAIDTTAPSAPSELNLLPESDSGQSNSDKITNVTTPTITGNAEAGTSVQLESDGELLGQTTATADGDWQIATSNKADGTQSLTATATDAAGNVSSASTPLDVVVDTQAPVAPTGLRLTEDTDTGSSNSDNVTSNTTPTIQGTGEAGALIRLTLDDRSVGQTTATANGDWQISIATALSNGEHTFTAQALDIAGNVSASSQQLVVTIETGTNTQTQAVAEIYGLDPYPDAIALVPGTTRQLSVKLNGLSDSPDLTASSTGTQYSVSDSDVLSVSPDGLITANSSGEATVTVTNGEAVVVIPVQVEAPQPGPVTVGVDGGIVQASDGSMVAIAPGALEENTTVSLTPLSQQNLSLPVPEGFKVAGAFNLEIGDDILTVPAQLAIPAPEGLPVGTEVVFMRKGALPDETGTWNPIWLQEESGVVGADGMIRTQSPPFPGVAKPGEYIVVSDAIGSTTLVKGKLTFNYNYPLAYVGVIFPGITPGGGAFGQLASPSNLVDINAFSATYDISDVKVIAVPTVGLPVITTVGVQYNASGIATFEATLDMPAPTSSDPTASPVVQKVELKFKDEFNQPFANNEPVLFLQGGNILVNNSSTPKGNSFNDLTVNFYVGDAAYSGTVLPELSQELSNNQFKVAVKVPNALPLGDSRIVLSRKQDELVGQNGTQPVYQEIQFDSNEIRLQNGGEYVFAALAFSDSVAVLNGSNPESVVETTSSKDLLLAKIPVGTDGSQDWPQAIALTSVGSRAYVTLEMTGSVALVDPIVLQQVDTQPLTPEVNPISLPGSAKPRSIVISPWDEYAYIADAQSGKIYVLDINPFSETYHQVIQTISVGSALSGLRQMAISSDGRKLFAAAPSSSNSHILVINIDPLDQPIISSQNPRKWHEQIGAVVANNGAEGLAATSNPLKMTFTNSSSDGTGFGVLEITNDDPLNFAATTRYAPLNLGSTSDYFDVNNAVATEVTDDLSYAFVVGRNAINFGLGVESIDGVQAGSNIGIISDPLGPSPQLIAATRPIPGVAFATDLELSNDNKYLYASYPNAGGVYVFDVEEITNTIQNPGNYVIDNLDRGTGSPFFNSDTQRSANANDLHRVPIDDINPNISIAADYEITEENRPANQFVYGVPYDTTRAPIGTGGSPRGLSASPELNKTPREQVQEISRKIAVNIRNGNQPNLPAPDKDRFDKNIADQQKKRSLPLSEFVEQVQADSGSIDGVEPAKGIYSISFEVAEQDDQKFYGTSSVIWNLAPVSQSVFSIGKDIASQPNKAPLPAGVLFTTPLGVGGSTIQGRVQPYPGDIDFSERFDIKAPNINSAAVAAAETIVEFVQRTKNNPNFEFQELVISTLNDGTVKGKPKKTLSYDEIVSRSKFDKLVDALKNLNSQNGNVNTFWRAKTEDERFINISKILDITAKKSTGTSEEILFSTRQTIGEEELLLSQQVIDDEDDFFLTDFFLTRLSGAEYQTAYLDKPEQISSDKLSGYANLMRKNALTLADKKGKYLKAAKRAFNYFLAIGNIDAIDAIQPIFERPEARVNQEVAVMEAIESALDPNRPQTRILKVGEARDMLNNAAEIIEDNLPAGNIANNLRQLATQLSGNSSDLLQQKPDQSDTLQGLVTQTDTLVNQGLKPHVEPIINTYLRPYYQGLNPLA